MGGGSQAFDEVNAEMPHIASGTSYGKRLVLITVMTMMIIIRMSSAAAAGAAPAGEKKGSRGISVGGGALPPLSFGGGPGGGVGGQGMAPLPSRGGGGSSSGGQAGGAPGAGRDHAGAPVGDLPPLSSAPPPQQAPSTGRHVPSPPAGSGSGSPGSGSGSGSGGDDGDEQLAMQEAVSLLGSTDIELSGTVSADDIAALCQQLVDTGSLDFSAAVTSSKSHETQKEDLQVLSIGGCGSTADGVQALVAAKDDSSDTSALVCTSASDCYVFRATSSASTAASSASSRHTFMRASSFHILGKTTKHPNPFRPRRSIAKPHHHHPN